MKKLRALFAISLGLIPFGLVQAHEEPPAEAGPTSPWSGKVGVGYLATAGNSDNTALNANFDLAYDKDKWHHLLNAVALGTVADDVTTAERYQLGYKAQYDFSEFNYVFGLLGWEKDRFSGVAEQTTQAVGYGRRIINNERHVLNAEVGVGAKQLDFADGTEESGTVLRGAMDYAWAISDTANFTQTLALENGADNTYIESVSSLGATIVGNIGLSISYTVKHNTDAPVGFDETDTYTAVNLDYVF
ncbi:MAG: DUF481 domain-containing protein [Pseudomonadota bacterium]